MNRGRIREIVAEVSARRGVPERDIRDSGDYEPTMARQEAIALCYSECGYGERPKVHSFFGLHESTCRRAVIRHNERMS